jgi:cobalt-zinc-cadmium efflux system protein
MPDHTHNYGSNVGSRLLFSILLNLVITIAEMIGGIISGSLALLSDSFHNLADTSSLFISYGAEKISRRKRNKKYTYGFKRVEILATILNTTALLAIAIFLFREAVIKFLNPAEIDSNLMIIVATIGLAGNIITAFLLFGASKKSLNIKSSFIHIVSDSLSSVFVIIGGLLIKFYSWWIVDPILTMIVVTYITIQSLKLLKEAIEIIMQATPRGITVDEVKKAVDSLSFVNDTHHIHIWTTNGKDIFVECHVIIDDCKIKNIDEYLNAIRSKLTEIGVSHSTVQIERYCNTE